MNRIDTILNIVPFVLLVGLGIVLVRVRHVPLWAEAFRRLRRNRLAIAALVVVSIYAVIGLADSIVWRENKQSDARSIIDRVFEREPERTYSAPFASMTTGEPTPHPLKGKHILGTDGVGQDVLYRTLKGCRTALLLGVVTSLISTPLALMFGLLAGFFGRRVDDLIQYIYSVLASIPSILLLIALMMAMGRGVLQLCIALGVTQWVGLCRLSRGETLKHRDRDYVRAARALGQGNAQILIKHILPNLLPLVIISVTLGLSSLVLAEAILSYLQIGVPPGVGSWGNMIDSARMELSREPVIWWNLASASTALFILVLGFNIFGDALRDAIDPRLRS